MLHAATGLHIPKPVNDRLFVEWQCYDWRAWDEFAMACWHQNRLSDALWANFRILCQSQACPEERIIGNISHCSRPGPKLEALKDFWRQFRKLPRSERNPSGLRELFSFSADVREFEGNIYEAIENGGGFPK